MSTIQVKQPNQDQIKQAIGAVTDQIQKDPTASNAEFKANSNLNKGLLANINIRNFDLKSDEPESLGGTDQGPNPVELVLGAFAACQEIVISAYASVLDIEIKNVRVETKGKLDLRGFFNLSDTRAGFNDVEFQTVIETDEDDEEKLKQLEHFAHNRCPVLDIINNPTPVNGSVTFTN